MIILQCQKKKIIKTIRNNHLKDNKMKTTKIITVTLITIMLFSLGAYSQNNGKGKGMVNIPAFETFDLDGNGQITASEFDKVRGQRQNNNA